MRRYIPITYDKMFKKVFGDPNNTDKLAYLLSTIFKIPFEDLKDNIEIIESEKRVNKVNEKMSKSDIVLNIKFSSFGKVNLEMNVGFYKEVIVRNLRYNINLLSSSLKVGKDYSNIKPVIQINFNTYDIDKNSQKILDLFTLKNDNNYELTDILQYHINIDKWYKCWYNGDIERYSEEDQKLIRCLALLKITNNEDFTKCIGETDMEDEIKKDFVDTMDELCSDEEIERYYGSDEDLEKLRISGEKIKIKEAKEEGIITGRAEGKKQEKIEIARKMLENDMDIDTISKLTNLSKLEIEKLH